MLPGSRSQSVRRHNHVTHRINRAARCGLETLENRTLLSTIVWDNRGTTDNFGIYPNPALARNIVDRAIDEWERVIVDFNYSGGGNTYHVDVFAGPISGRGATDNAVYNAQGKPTSADIFLDDNGEGGGWFFDPDPGSATVPDDSEYTTWITPFAGDGAGVGNDFYRTIVHELGHAMGILVGTAGVASGNPAINSFMTDSGFNDANSGANLMAFNVGGGAVEATLTATGGGHFYEGPAVGGLPIHPNDLLNAGRTVDVGLNRRQLISDLDATVLDLAYGYTITLPSQINSMYANLNTVTNTLNVIGLPGAAADNITLSLSGGNLRVQVNGTSEIIPAGEMTSVVVNAGAGNDTINIDGLTAGLTSVTVNAGDGTDTINLGGGDIDSNLDSNLTVNGGTGTDTIRFEDTLDGLNGDTYLISTSFLNKGGRIVNFSAAEALDVFGSAQPSDYTIQSLAANVSLDITAGAAADTFVIGTGDFDGTILGDLRITGGGGVDEVTVNDTADLGNDAWQLSGIRLEKFSGTGSASLLNTTEVLIVNGSGADNDWYVPQMSSWLDVTFNGGAGADTFDVARGTADLDNNILGILRMNGGGGGDALLFRDTADGLGSDSYTMTASTLDKPLIDAITFTSMSSITLDASQNADTINVTGIGGALVVRGNNGDDVIDVDTDIIVIGTSCVVDTGNGLDELRVNADGAGGTSVRLASSQTLASLNVAAGGTLTVDAGGDKVLRINDLVSLGGRINLNDNALIREAGAGIPNLATWITWCTNGYNGGDWLGAQPAIISTPADASSFSLGYARASSIFGGGGGVFAGQPVSADAICVRYTRYGDANLDGTVNLQDFNRLAASFGATGTVWSQGNFNYDNVTNLADFNKLAGNFGLSASPDAMAGGPAMSQGELRKLLDQTTGGTIDVTGARWSRRLVGATDVEEIVTAAALARTA